MHTIFVKLDHINNLLKNPGSDSAGSETPEVFFSLFIEEIKSAQNALRRSWTAWLSRGGASSIVLPQGAGSQGSQGLKGTL